RASGASERAEEYARVVRNVMPDAASEADRSRQQLDQARTLASKGQVEDAFNLAMQALNAGHSRPEMLLAAPMVAGELASKKQPEKADLLYQRLFAIAESVSGQTLQPLLNLYPEYTRLLHSQSGRQGDALNALARYRELAIEAHGSSSGQL